MSFDADGTAYVSNLAFADSRTFSGTASDIVVNHSTDGGQTWSRPVRVAKGSGNDLPSGKSNFPDKEYIVAWGHGNAIVTWTQYHYGPKGAFVDAPVYASVTHDGGNTWTVPAPLTAGEIGNPQVVDFPSVPTAAADGSIDVAYEKSSVSLVTDIDVHASRSEYMVVKVDPTTGQPVGTPADLGLVYDGPHDYAISNRDRQTYQDSQFRTNAAGNITADPTNADHLAVVWSDMRNNPYPDAELPSSDPYAVVTNSDIIVSQSFDGGQTWLAAVALAFPGDQFQPWGAFNSSGQLQIGYVDRSYDPANHKYGYTLASEATPGSLAFTFQQVTTALSDPTRDFEWGSTTVNPGFPSPATFLGDYSGIAVVPGTNQVAALWTDMREQSTSGASVQDAYFALLDTPDAPAVHSLAVTGAELSSPLANAPAAALTLVLTVDLDAGTRTWAATGAIEDSGTAATVWIQFGAVSSPVVSVLQIDTQFTNADGTGTFTIRRTITSTADGDQFLRTGTWHVVDATGIYAGLRGHGTLTGVEDGDQVVDTLTGVLLGDSATNQ